jgi:hypothetical protein
MSPGDRIENSNFFEGGQIMYRKLLFLMSFVLVFGLAVNATAQIDPATVTDGHVYRSANVSDGQVVDSSAVGLAANIIGDPQVVDILGGRALQFDGVDDGVHIPDSQFINITNGPWQNRTVIAVFNVVDANKPDPQVVFQEGGGTRGFNIYVQDNQVTVGGWNKAEYQWNPGSWISAPIASNEWHAVAFVLRDGADAQEDDKFELWMDGELIAKAPGGQMYNHSADNSFGYSTGTTVLPDGNLGGNAGYFEGLISEVWILNQALTQAELAPLMAGPQPVGEPLFLTPVDGTQLEETTVMLEWRPGELATSHNVYMGTDLDEVAAGTVPAVNTTQGLVTAGIAGGPIPDGLVPDTTYYWRVESVNDVNPESPWTSSVRSIWLPPRRAYDPSPADGKAILELSATLTWTGGWNPIMHNVNFGTDPAALAPVSMMQMDATYDTGPLEPGTTYYWRIDEFYGTETITGPVWSFSTVPEIPLTDEPNLVADWTMDEAAGDVVLDMSGNANHLLVFGGAQVVNGAMELDGVDDILEAPDNSINGIFDVNGAEFTAIATVNPSRLLPAVTNHNIGNVLLSRGSDGYNDNFEFGFSAEGDAMIYTDTDGGDTTRVVGDGEITVGESHQVIVVYDANAIDIYLDGVRYSTQVSGVSFDQADGSPFTIGDTRHVETPYGGLVDDVKIYNRAMSVDEVRQAYLDVALAYEPDPAPGSTDVDVLSVLSWTAGEGAVEHDVYLGTDKAAVAAADASVYLGRQADTTYAPGILDFGAKLYWRVDEVAADGTVTAGKVWSLTTAEELVIYDEPTPLDYDTSVDPFMSEVSLDLDPAQNWTDPIGRLIVDYTGAAAPGSVTVDDAAGTVTVVGRGDDIWGTADQFQYAYTTLTGDGSMTVKVDSLDFTDPWTKAGIMIRETLDAGSSFAAVFATGENGVRFQARSMANESATSDTPVATDEQKALTPPVWIKIERAFPMVNAYYSTDGVNFVPMSWNPQVIPMSPAPIYIGLAVTSHSGADTYATAVFSEMTSDGGVAPGPLTSAEIGLVGNAAAPMSLVLEDASGASAAVTNPDPAATQQASATDFVVDLADFDIDLTAVAKATLVIGDGTPGGTGSITINSVSLTAAPELVSAFAFGSRQLDCATYNVPSVNYTMVLHDSVSSVQYDAARGYGYEVIYPTDSPFGDRGGYGVFGPFDDSPNNRNDFGDDCPEQLYDSFIGAKNFTNEVSAATMGDMDIPSPDPEGIIFRVDVPNGFYRFVAAVGEADNVHAHRMLAEDGGSGPPENIGSHVVLVSNHDQAQYTIGEPDASEPGEGVFARVGFDGKIPPLGDGTAPDPQFVDMDANGMATDAGPDSPILEVTQGYIRIHQLQGNSNDGPGGERDPNGGDIVILELWKVIP